MLFYLTFYSSKKSQNKFITISTKILTSTTVLKDHVTLKSNDAVHHRNKLHFTIFSIRKWL